MPKDRVPIPTHVATEVMFLSDSTCCKCRERGKAVQIHHIDEDPSNNEIDNLSVLCLECHNETQIKGGFGRKLNKDLVLRYRDEWLQRVEKRRDKADEIAVLRTTETDWRNSKSGLTSESIDQTNEDCEVIEYVNSLPKLKKQLEEKAQEDWDSGVTANMIQASYDYIGNLEAILIRLAAFYPAGTFGENSHVFFADQTAVRFKWHRSYSEPDGPGTGGTIINVAVASSVMEDIEKMVEDMVMGLVGYDEGFDWKSWPTKWRGDRTGMIKV